MALRCGGSGIRTATGEISPGRAAQTYGQPPRPYRLRPTSFWTNTFAPGLHSPSRAPRCRTGGNSLVWCSAPGVDGEPYEIYHVGARFIACLARALLTWATLFLMPCSARPLTSLSGPRKAPGAEAPNDPRPLQLLTCFRRLFGAAIAHVAGPVVEPALSPDQAGRLRGATWAQRCAGQRAPHRGVRP